VDIVFDGIGRAAAAENYDAIAVTGHWVSYGQATGPVPALDPARQAAKSLRMSRPVLFHYTGEARRLHEMAKHVFEMVERGILRVTPRHRMPLAAAAAAHAAIEARQTIGAVVLVA
jgi:NADPH:quinone reductase-like Zn-dependent oxidoreductase